MVRKIAELIRDNRRFLVAAHGKPDGDALAATLALANALKSMGKEVVAYNQDHPPVDLQFLPGCDALVTTLEAGSRFDVGFILDAGSLDRAGSHLKEHCRLLVNIDHHPYSESFGAVNYVDVRACATGVLVYRILAFMNYTFDLPVATCVYTAILSDTGSFRYSNADREAFEVAGRMIELGVDPWEISSRLYESQPEERLHLLGMALGTLEVSPCGRYASLTVTLDMYQMAGASAEHTDRFVNYPRSIEGVEVALFYRQVDENRFKVGFRSRGRVDVGAIARQLGGGGHHNAAGALVDGSIDLVKQKVSRLLTPVLAAL
ncbi:phosphoesterase RecJ-like protein [Geothermobacter ehrlichii]|uniref:Phosphoesterase RecJ-like protein n=1 Tax=Geothermobacter ehrlichii TaxID=213224 RepID=A0A5D3WNP3_9BACT|nr:DHH family phosphoesterase [Geothermobacter ehrlichii]TYO99718.1 phosphoesterase RecJ-like protein [Geothermobacter ehrlichii]